MALPRIQQFSRSGSGAVAGAASTGSITAGAIESSGSINASGSITAVGGFTGSLQGTATTASYVSPTFISASAAAFGFGASILTGSFATTGSNQFIGSQAITGSLFLIGSSSFISTPAYQTNDFFLVRNTTTTLKVVTGGLQISSSAQTPLQVFDQNNNSILNISQSGVVVFATQSASPTESAANGAIWLTNTEFYVGLS